MQEEETIEQALESLFRKGLISVEYDENLQALFKPTVAGIAVVEALE